MPKQLTAIIPSSATISSLMLGILAIISLDDNRFFIAGVLIILGSILDVLDGQLAKRLDSISDMGKELDSLADMVTFGVAPTMLIYHLLLSVGVAKHIAILSSLVFVSAGALRLARFNTLPSDRRAYFEGMPIPMASLFIITGSFWQHWVINIWWTVVIIIVSYLMVSPFSYVKFTHVSNFNPFVWAIVAFNILFWWLMGGWYALPFGMFVLYAISGPMLSMFVVTRKKLRHTKQ